MWFCCKKPRKHLFVSCFFWSKRCRISLSCYDDFHQYRPTIFPTRYPWEQSTPWSQQGLHMDLPHYLSLRWYILKHLTTSANPPGKLGVYSGLDHWLLLLIFYTPHLLTHKTRPLLPHSDTDVAVLWRLPSNVTSRQLLKAKKLLWVCVTTDDHHR